MQSTSCKRTIRCRETLSEVGGNNFPVHRAASGARTSQRIDCIHYDDWRRTFEGNTLGTVRVTEALIGNLERDEELKLVVVISSHMGSIADIDASDSLCYRSSKAALNAAMQGLAVALQPRNIGVLLLHPGGVMTRMGPEKGIPKRESVDGMRHTSLRIFPWSRAGPLFNTMVRKWRGEILRHEAEHLFTTWI